MGNLIGAEAHWLEDVARGERDPRNTRHPSHTHIHTIVKGK